ncbi:nitroreductase family deazaflavin-dependent oxidoreductase [Nocardia sp. CNY236]|uniref:nitroreductase family deazaflavin-dependent oxidoreductase n=1 Tax=Nocardia sp. CNY236 TaxID=1169152 RepID=UPI00048EAFA1|nr:nitroreductase family deazaflavin-dependent oxidoreductase [Nocardia sp. CNY236]
MGRRLFKIMLKAHQWVYEKTGGRVGHRLLAGRPTLLLRTVGRKTGQQRTSALTYTRDGADYVVVASNGGSPQPPGWLANLKARPECEIQIAQGTMTVSARPTLPDDPDYARRWAIIDAAHRGRYSNYQKKTTRTIPIVVLTPSPT